MMLISDMTDSLLERTIENCSNCGDAAGGYASEAWDRYQKEKEHSGDLNIKILQLEAKIKELEKECQELKTQLEQSDNYYRYHL